MGKKILLADDSLTIQKVVELTLAGTDYDLTCVSNGQEALESLRRSRPDLILADVVMPGKNGYEVCEAVKGNPATAGIPVLLLSGTFEPFDRDRAGRIAADRVVSKPFDAQQLLDQIESLLTRSAGERPLETAFLDDTIPTGRSAGRSEAVKSESPSETSSPRAAAERQVPPSDRYSEVLAKEEAPAETAAGFSVAEAELAGAEEFSGGPVFLPVGETGAAPEEAQTRHPVEETPASEPPVEGTGPRRISAQAEEILFDVSAVAAPVPPAALPPALTELTQEQIERIAAVVVAKLSDRVLREIVWEVVPDVAEMVVKRRIEELESDAE